MRQFLAILLLLAAVIHPLAHIDEPLVCSCAHGALAEVAPPPFAEVEGDEVAHPILAQAYVPVAVVAQLPARAPPVA